MKKFAALFATVLVMALSATSVLAAVSPSMDSAAETPTCTLADGTTVTGTAVTTVTEADAKAAAAAAVPANTTSATVAVFSDINGTIPTGASSVDVTIPAAGVTANSNVIVLNYNATSASWDECTVTGKADGEVTATFTHFSPVMVITYTVAQTTTPTTTTTPSYTYTDTTTVSPKTGVLPVAAIAAGICLAGAAVCGKKVKFN